MIAPAPAVPSTPMELVSRLTEQDVTPGTLDTAFSTLLLQAAQLIPVTLYCSISIPPTTYCSLPDIYCSVSLQFPDLYSAVL